MGTKLSLAVMVAFAYGCASAGGGSEQPPVPVFATVGDVPCEYEVLEPVRGSGPAPRSTNAYELDRARILGREGARIGADAVIAEERSAIGTTVRRPLGTSGTAAARPSPVRSVDYSGQAIRYTSDGCAG
jgi:hypothetical protein